MRILSLSLASLMLLATSCNTTSSQQLDPKNNSQKNNTKSDSKPNTPIVIRINLKTGSKEKASTIYIERNLSNDCNKDDNAGFTSCITNLFDNTQAWKLGRTEGKLSSPDDNLLITGMYHDPVDHPSINIRSDFGWQTEKDIPSKGTSLAASTPPISTYTAGLETSPKAIPLPQTHSDKAIYSLEVRLVNVTDKKYISKCEGTNLPKSVSVFVSKTDQPACVLLIGRH